MENILKRVLIYLSVLLIVLLEATNIYQYIQIKNLKSIIEEQKNINTTETESLEISTSSLCDKYISKIYQSPVNGENVFVYEQPWGWTIEDGIMTYDTENSSDKLGYLALLTMPQPSINFNDRYFEIFGNEINNIPIIEGRKLDYNLKNLNDFCIEITSTDSDIKTVDGIECYFEFKKGYFKLNLNDMQYQNIFQHIAESFEAK